MNNPDFFNNKETDLCAEGRICQKRYIGIPFLAPSKFKMSDTYLFSHFHRNILSILTDMTWNVLCSLHKQCKELIIIFDKSISGNKALN